MEKFPFAGLIYLPGGNPENIGPEDKNQTLHDMKTSIFLFAAALGITSAAAQTAAPTSTSAQPPAASIIFTNHSGGTFSVDQLANQLQNLRTAVDELLPNLTAFNESVASTSASKKGWTGTLSGLVSDSLQKNSKDTSGQSPS